MRISVQGGTLIDDHIGLFRMFELPDGVTPCVDIDRTPMVYGITVEQAIVDGVFCYDYLHPIGNDWMPVMHHRSCHYFLLPSQPSEGRYLAVDGNNYGYGENIMAAKRDMDRSRENPVWRA